MLGHGIQRVRKAAQFSQKQLADAISVEQPTISRWERGEDQCPLRRLPEIEAALDMPLGSVLAAAGFIEVTAVEAALFADDALDPRDLELIRGVYRDAVGRQRRLGARKKIPRHTKPS